MEKEKFNLNQKIIDFLDSHKIQYSLFHHEDVRTSEEAAQVRGSKLAEGAKALIFNADSLPIQIILPANKKVDSKNFKKLFKVKDLTMAKYEMVEEISSVLPGAVPPFGNLFPIPLKMYVDKELFQNEFIEFNAGNRGISIKMKAEDYKNIMNDFIISF
ncbi:hypothetical protein KA001_01095 [Patescibacteria group bacterium]|nr:hypothetical protein [Patescibacteria group bacterium]